MAVVEIVCPDCGERDAVVKVGVGRYRCRECGAEFGPDDLRPAVD